MIKKRIFVNYWVVADARAEMKTKRFPSYVAAERFIATLPDNGLNHMARPDVYLTRV